MVGKRTPDGGSRQVEALGNVLDGDHRTNAMRANDSSNSILCCTHWRIQVDISALK
jgi:hypothetical protein